MPAAPSPARRFPKPWRAEAVGECWQVADATGFVLTRFFFEERPERRNEMRRLTPDEARRLALNFARLPDLLEIAKRVGAPEPREG